MRRHSSTPVQDWPVDIKSVANPASSIDSSVVTTSSLPPPPTKEPPPPSPSTKVPPPPPVTTKVSVSSTPSSSFKLSPLSPSRPPLDTDTSPPSCTERIRTYLVDHSTYFRLHFLYFVLLGHISAISLYCIENFQYSYVDCLYMAYSAVCMVGLASLDVAKLTIASQIVLMFTVLLGGVVLSSVVPVLIRRFYFEAKAAEAIDNEDERKKVLQDLSTEYRALGYIRNIVLIYWFTVQLGTFLLLGIAIVSDSDTVTIMDQRNVNPWWWALFHAVTSFNNAGFGLFSDNLIPVATRIGILNLLSIAILFGNTMYPINMRIIVWICHRIWPKDAAFKFLLDRPRKCFSHMFRADQTKVLAFMLIALTFIDFFTFLGLDYSRPFLETFTGPQRALIGWFQAISTRTAGFNTIDLSLSAAGMQVMYAWMMYVAAYPTVITIRKSADAEEKAKQEAKLISNEIEEMEERDKEINEMLRQKGISETDPYGEIEIKEISETNNELSLPIETSPNYRTQNNTVNGGNSTGLKDSEISVTFEDTTDSSKKDNNHGSNDGTLSTTVSNGQRTVLPHVQAKQQQHLLPQLSLVPVIGTPDQGKYGIPESKTVRARAFFDQSYYESARQLNIRRNSFGGESTLELDVPIPLQYNDEAQRKIIEEKIKSKHSRGVVDQARGLVARDISVLFLGFLLISIAESIKIEEDSKKALNNWSIFFEVVSAFGTVGLTLGYPGYASSLSTIFTPFSKFILMGIMLAGRHRGLPSSIDPAVYLPALLNRTKSRKPTDAPGTVNGKNIDNNSILEFGSVVEKLNSLSLVVRQKLNGSPSSSVRIRTGGGNLPTGRSYGGGPIQTPSRNQRTLPATLEAADLAAVARNVARAKYANSRLQTLSDRKLPMDGILSTPPDKKSTSTDTRTDTDQPKRSLAHIFQPTTSHINPDINKSSRSSGNGGMRIPESIAEGEMGSETPKAKDGGGGGIELTPVGTALVEKDTKVTVT